MFQFIVSLEAIMMTTAGSPCSFCDLQQVIYFFTKLPIALLASNQKFESQSDRWQNGNKRKMLGDITVDIVRRLMLQCPYCFRRVAIIAKDYHQSCAFHLDHDTERFEKVLALSDFFRNKSSIGYVKWILFESFKLRGNPCEYLWFMRVCILFWSDMFQVHFAMSLGKRIPLINLEEGRQ